MNKIGVGIITYNRPDYYKKVLEKIPRHKINYLVVVNDGQISYAKQSDADFVILNNEQLGVSVSKNKALKVLIEQFQCEHLFLIEDDILIKDETVFDEYIKAANSTGIHHLCYEKVAGNEKTLKYTHEQPDGTKIGFYHNPQGAFMYINSNLIKKLGYFDENYKNAFEHIDFAYKLIKNNVAPPFWYFPDLLNSDDYLTDIEGSSQNSSITNKEKYKENWELSAKHFVSKWGHFTNTIEDVGIKNLENSLICLQKHYSRKKYLNKNQFLTVVIPYRNRETALTKIVPELTEYISKQIENFEILIVEQLDDKPFNKGVLNNIGFTLKNKKSTYVCFHDVDLIPKISDYSYPKNPTHMSSHCSQFNYVNIPDEILGGVILFKNEHFEKVNGYSNEYSGWGKEDNDLYARCIKENLKIYKHPFGRFYSIPHQHRLTIPEENELHLKNGKRFNLYLNGELGETYHKEDGISSIPNYTICSNIEIFKNTKHIKIKF